MTIEKRYFHLLTDTEFKALGDKRWCDLPGLGYVQPDWCAYPDALSGLIGCWSLIYRRVTGKEYCRACECFRSAGMLPKQPEAS